MGNIPFYRLFPRSVTGWESAATRKLRRRLRADADLAATFLI